MAKRKRSKNIISIIVALILMIGATIGIVNIANNTSKTISPSVFSIGSINDKGEFSKSKTTLYSKDFIECQGLKITRDFESIVTYKVHYYDILKNYLGSSGVQSGDYAIEDTYANAKYCRIVIYKGNNENIKFYEPYSIASELTIKVDKSQNYEQYNKFDLNNEDIAFSYNGSGAVGNYIEDDNYISCIPIDIFQENDYKYDSIVIVSEYNFAELTAATNFNSIVSFCVSMSKQNVVLASKNLKELKPTALSDGRYGYLIKFNVEDFEDAEDRVVSVVFNALKTQPNPEVYLYGYSSIKN